MTSLLSQNQLTTSGTDFWFGYMDNYLIDEDATYTLLISSDQATTGTVEIPLLGWSQSFTTTIGTTTSINIPLFANNNESGVVSNKGIHVTSNAPINLYANNHVNNSADATRILPKPFLDITYFVNAYAGQTNIVDTLRSELLIVATEPATQIEIVPSCDMLGGILQNVPFTIELNQGETFLLKASETQDVSGTTIEGTEVSGDCRPFAVFGGSECSFVPQLCSPCDHLFDQLVPSSVWGTDYLLGTFDTWISSYTYRITALQNGTQVSVDGVPTFTLNAGQTQEVNSNSDPVFLSANNPIGVIQYMEGGGCTISGDPSMMTVNAVSQTMTQVTFATIVSEIVTDHHLQIMVPTNAINSVFLDGSIVPNTSFDPFIGNPEFSFADVEIIEGSHQLECTQGFIANVYGIGDAESYLYSTGAVASEPTEPLPTVFCTENQVVLESEENYVNVWWSTLEDPETLLFTGQPFVINPPIQNQIYILHGEQFLSGCPVEELFSVESPAPLEVDIMEEAVSLCLFEEYTFSPIVSPVGSSYIFEWTDPSAFVNSDEQNGTISPNESETYYLSVSTFSGCASGIDSVEVTVLNDDLTFVHAAAEPSLICAGEPVSLEVLIGSNAGIDFFNSELSSVNWADEAGAEIGEVCNAIGNSALFFAGGGTRFVESTDKDVSLGGAISFSLFISDGTTGCDGAEFGEDVILEFSTNGGFSWNTLEVFFENQFPVFQSIDLILPPEAETPSTRFRWSQPNFSGVNEDVWALDNVVFSAFGTTTNAVEWTSSATITNSDATSASSSPLEDSWYFVEVANNGCTFLDSLFVEVQPAFDLIISPDTAICSPSPLQLFVEVSEPGFYSYEWSPSPLFNASDFQNPIATPNENTTFTVNVSSSAGCTNSASVDVTLLNSEAPFISTPATNVCEVPVPMEVVVEGDPSLYTFEWNQAEVLDDPTAQNVLATPASGSFTTFEVVVTNTETGCQFTGTQNIFAQFAEFNLPSDTTICESEGFIIEYEVINSSFNFIEWDNPDVLDNAFTEFPMITVPDFNGDLIVTMIVPGQNGCVVADTITITTQPLQYSAPDILSICPNSTVQATITGEYDLINWTPSANLDTTDPEIPVFSNIVNETFYFQLEDLSGCSLNDSIQIVLNLPTAFEIVSEDPLCEGTEMQLQIPINNMQYLWDTGATSQNLIVTDGGTYTATVQDSAGCSITDEIVLELLSAPTFEIMGETSACEGETITLLADIEDVDYLWNTNSTEQTENFSLTGIQTVWAEVVNANGCVYRDSIDLFFTPSPDLTLSSDGSICDGSTVTLLAEADEVDFLWENDATTASIEVNEPGYYTVTVVDEINCTTSDSILVMEVFFPEFLALDTALCIGNQLSFNLELDPEFSFSWSTGDDGQTVTINQPGDYQLTLEQLGCISVYDFVVEEKDCPEPYIYIPNAFTPDNDGLNDVWQVVVSDLIDTFEVLIFNRDGDVIFRSSDPEEYWTGNAYGGEYYVPNGVYNYLVKYTTTDSNSTTFAELLRGHITVLR